MHFFTYIGRTLCVKFHCTIEPAMLEYLSVNCVNEVPQKGTQIMINKKRLTAVIISLSMLIMMLFTGSVYAYEGVIFNNDSISDVQMIKSNMTGFGVTTSWEYPYSDALFDLPSNEYNHILARSSIGLAMAAFRDTKNKEAQDDNLIEFLEATGFEDIITETYKSAPTTAADSIAYGLAHKSIEDYTLVAVPVCGGNYTKEWASNFTIGDSIRSDGFNAAAQVVTAAVYDYIDSNNITGNIKIWITGYSRGGGVSNIAAADLTDSGKFIDVYAYCFAAPRTTKEPGSYDNIFNIISKDDVVTKVPFADWGYKRYGTDLYTKSIEADTDSMEVIEASGEIYKQLTGANMTVNPEINYQLRIICDYLYKFLPTSAEYKEKFQPLLLEIIEAEDKTIGITGLIDVMMQFSQENEDFNSEIQDMIDFLQQMANTYVLSGNKEQKSTGAWDTELGMFNLFNEHLPYKYIARLFASDDPNEIYSENTAYTRLAIYADVDIQIIKDGLLVENVTSDGIVRDFYSDKYYDMPDVRFSKSGYDKSNKYILTLPADSEWDIYISGDRIQSLGYINSAMSAETTKAELSDYYVINMEAEQLYKIMIKYGQVVQDEETGTYTSSIFSFSDIEYSPSSSMVYENSFKKYITIEEVLGIGLLIITLVVFELLLSIVLAIVRRVRKKPRRGPIAWAWTLINVAIFAIVEVQIWYYIPAYPIAKAIVKGIVLFLIIGILLKGWKKYRTKRNRILVPALIMACVADFVLERLYIGERNTWNIFIPLAVYLWLMVSAWFVWHDTEKSQEIIENDDMGTRIDLSKQLAEAEKEKKDGQ